MALGFVHHGGIGLFGRRTAGSAAVKDQIRAAHVADRPADLHLAPGSAVRQNAHARAAGIGAEHLRIVAGPGAQVQSSAVLRANGRVCIRRGNRAGGRTAAKAEVAVEQIARQSVDADLAPGIPAPEHGHLRAAGQLGQHARAGGGRFAQVQRAHGHRSGGAGRRPAQGNKRGMHIAHRIAHAHQAPVAVRAHDFNRRAHGDAGQDGRRIAPHSRRLT